MTTRAAWRTICLSCLQLAKSAFVSLETAVASPLPPSRDNDAEVTAEQSMDGDKERSLSLPSATFSRLWNSHCQPPSLPPSCHPMAMTMMMPPLPSSPPPPSWWSSASTMMMRRRRMIPTEPRPLEATTRSSSEEDQRQQRQRVPRRRVSPPSASCFPPPPRLPACNHLALQHSVRHL
jgi:hypothetical protein